MEEHLYCTVRRKKFKKKKKNFSLITLKLLVLLENKLINLSQAADEN